MYHRQTSQDSEIMNAANEPIPTTTAVCPVNAVMLTIKTECCCFKTQQKSAWLLENEFSPCGEKEYTPTSSMELTTEISRSTSWIVAMNGNVALLGDWSAWW